MYSCIYRNWKDYGCEYHEYVMKKIKKYNKF